MLPMKLAKFHAFFVWCVFTILGAEYKYFATFMVFSFTLVPVFPAGYVTLPWAISAGLSGNYVTMTIFGYGINFVIGYIDWYSYEGQIKVHPYCTALSVALGCSTFGMQGLIIGPLIVCTTVLLFDSQQEYANLKARHDERRAFVRVESMKMSQTLPTSDLGSVSSKIKTSDLGSVSSKIKTSDLGSVSSKIKKLSKSSKLESVSAESQDLEGEEQFHDSRD